ncbi:hypothetical protein ACO0KY_19405 [Undibacterium sp. Dicai25W]|uniref:hypothetical protein n=1 Tax=Undibacterium sp. Dicai25W TaxID=3413034 RepID=UPI003BF0A25B
MTWPQYFPASCPPQDARSENIEVFRLIEESKAKKSDFLPTVIEFPHRKFDDACILCSVSVFVNIDEIKKRQARYSNLKSKKIAKGTIAETDGLILETLSAGHVSWWLKTDEPHRTFSEVTDGK